MFNPAALSNCFLVPKKEFACAVGVEVRGGAVTVPTEAAGFILSALESSGERATHRDHVSAWIRVCVRACASNRPEHAEERCTDV